MIIYLVTNLINGKRYVGQTTKAVGLRWREHCYASKRPTRQISLAIAKYGKDSFRVETLCVCSSIEDMNTRELYYANLYKTFVPKGYNVRAGNGYGKLPDATKAKISAAGKRRYLNKEHLEKMQKIWKARILTDEARRKMGAANKPSRLCIQRSVVKRAATFSMRNPQGHVVTFTNMAAFCRENDLVNSSLYRVYHAKRGARGTFNQHRGWRRV